jgi:hypothetical protein
LTEKKKLDNRRTRDELSARDVNLPPFASVELPFIALIALEDVTQCK